VLTEAVSPDLSQLGQVLQRVEEVQADIADDQPLQPPIPIDRAFASTRCFAGALQKGPLQGTKGLSWRPQIK
jgi:hypothetical protein